MDRLAQGGLRFNNFHTTALCSPTRQRAQDRPEPPHRQYRLDHGELDRLPGQHGQNPNSVAPWPRCCGSTATYRQRSASGTKPPPGKPAFGPVRPLAHAPGLRQVLRVHRRGDRPVVSAHLRRRDQGRPAEDGELPLHRRHDQPGDQLGEGAAVDDAGQAILRLLRDRARRMPRTTCRRSGPTSTRASTTRAGTQVRADTLERQKKLGVDPGNTQLASGRRTSRRGTRCRPISGVCSRARPKCSPDSSSRPTRRSGGSRRR